MQVIKEQLLKQERREAERKEAHNEHMDRLKKKSSGKSGYKDFEFEAFVAWQHKRREKELEEVLKVKKEIEERDKASIAAALAQRRKS